jgi:hypothetical protein
MPSRAKSGGGSYFFKEPKLGEKLLRGGEKGNIQCI